MVKQQHALLGLATTRQLLEELSARGRVDRITGELPVNAAHLERTADMLLAELPAELLNYRTAETDAEREARKASR